MRNIRYHNFLKILTISVFFKLNQGYDSVKSLNEIGAFEYYKVFLFIILILH